ncbi:MAG: serine/threonine protein kinase [Deltaproteobacteria bacterium]|nr:serine/threonine protein kinase [Deltaproteobacteria bacterium]
MKHALTPRFNRLSPDEVYHAVEVGGRRCTGRFVILNSYENRVYELELDDGARVVGKFYRPGRWSREAIREEHSFLRELALVEVPVAPPIEIEPGETIGEVDGVFFALFARVAGRAPEEFTDDDVKEVGRLLARIHNVGAARESSGRPPLSPATYGRENLEHLLAAGQIAPELRKAYEATVVALIERIEPLFRGVPTHRIHADCHLGNLVRTRAGLAFLDFDDMRMGPAVQDVWMLVASADAEGDRQRQLLIESYRAVRPFDDAWLCLVEPLRALRYIHYAAWIARRLDDPSFQRTFAHFGTLQYWQGQVQDLREQIARIDAASFRKVTADAY